MSISFSQSLRALGDDRAGFSPWLALAGTLLLGGWLAWFVTADISLYESSTEVSLLNNSEAEALFSPVVAAHIRPGQDAHLYLESGPMAQVAHLPATVTAVSSTPGAGTTRVRLTLNSTSEPVARATSIEIRVAQLTPAQLFLQAAGGL